MRSQRLLGRLLGAVFWSAALLAALIAFARFFFVDVAVIGHDAMAPTLVAGDEVLVLKNAQLQVGDIAICADPRNPGQRVVGRVVASDGSTVETVRGKLWLNGQSARYEPIREVSFLDETRGVAQDLTIAVEHLGARDYEIFQNPRRPFAIATTKVTGGLFLLSDHRAAPVQDSRTFGAVPAAKCIGRAFLRLRKSKTSPTTLGHGHLDWLR